MTDSQRLQATPEGIRLVSQVAAELARRHGGETSVLAVTTYLPIDVDSVARVFEGLEEIDGIERVEKGPLTVYEIADPERLADEDVALEEPKLVASYPGFMRVVATLKSDPEWVQKVRRQHQLLRMLAGADDTTIDLSYLTSRAQMSRARIQSLLNDFDAVGYIGVEFDEDVDKLRYTVPPLEYPEERMKRNLERIEQAEPPARSRSSFRVVLIVIAVVALMAIILLRF